MIFITERTTCFPNSPNSSLTICSKINTIEGDHVIRNTFVKIYFQLNNYFTGELYLLNLLILYITLLLLILQGMNNVIRVFLLVLEYLIWSQYIDTIVLQR